MVVNEWGCGSLPSVSRVKNVLYLGVHVDPHARRGELINIYVFKSLRQPFRIDKLKTFYFSLVQLLLTYGATYKV